MAAVEGPTGTWKMVDPQGREYGCIEIRRVMNGRQVAYKAIHRGDVIGWAHTLRLACHKVHVAHLATLGNPGPPAADWGGATGSPRRPSPHGRSALGATSAGAA